MYVIMQSFHFFHSVLWDNSFRRNDAPFTVQKMQYPGTNLDTCPLWHKDDCPIFGAMVFAFFC